jgi:hypothetical protein
MCKSLAPRLSGSNILGRSKYQGMIPMNNDKDESGKKKDKRKLFPQKWVFYILIIIIVTITVFTTFRSIFPPEFISSKGVSNAPELHGLIETLKKQGFEPNPGFSTKFPPGTVIQIISRDQSGNLVSEAIPRVFLTKYDCYPNILTESAEAVLPQSTGTNSGGVQLDAKLLKTFFPKLSIDSNIIENYSLVINYNTPQKLDSCLRCKMSVS